jgi:hypothetical protein
MHLYAFGSVCRGEFDAGSDVDVLRVVGVGEPAPYVRDVSTYTDERLRDLWRSGNPFAWHLAIESRLLFSPDGTDVIKNLGEPAAYSHAVEDCRKLESLFHDATASVRQSTNAVIYDLGMIFLAIRNFAISYSLGIRGVPLFSRQAAMMLGPDSAPLDVDVAYLLWRAKLLSTRGRGEPLGEHETRRALEGISGIPRWMTRLLARGTRDA